METMLTVAQVTADPGCIAARIESASGLALTFRPVTAEDAGILGRYFLGLSEDTKQRYGPHAFDQKTADELCARVNYAETIRMIATLAGEGQEQVIAYFILQMSVPDSESARYEAAGVALDWSRGCLIAPSVADAYQNHGIGSPLMRHMFRVAHCLGKRYMLLMGGVYADNARAVHYYGKTGFQKVGEFMPTWPNGHLSYDMYCEV